MDGGGMGGPPKNPMFKCRIFVGNLPTDFLTKPEVVERFAKYGPVTGMSTLEENHLETLIQQTNSHNTIPLRKLLKLSGKKSEVSLHRGFAFVQFKNTEDAEAAILGEKGADFKGSEIDCSFAKHERGSKKKEDMPSGRGGGSNFNKGVGGFLKSGSFNDDKDKGGYDRDKGPGGRFDDRERGGPGGRFDDRDKDRFRDFDRDRDRYPPFDRERERAPYDRDGPLPPRGGRDRSPIRDRFDDRYREDRYREEMLRRDRDYFDRRTPPRRDPRDLDPYDRDRLPPRDGDRLPPRDDPYARRDDPRDDPYFRDRDRDRDLLARDDPYRRDRETFDRDRDPYDRDRVGFRDRDRDMRDPLDRRGPPPMGPDPSLDGPIDCEIIVVNKAQKDYAESIQARVKRLQLQVGIIYLNSEMQLTTALDDVSRRGVLYAIVVTGQHEVHKSVTVNILHGTPQEHRNMPLEDAMGLIGRNFDRYMQNLRDKSGLPPPGPAGQSRAAAPQVSPPVRQGAPPPSGGGPGSLPAAAPAGGGVELTIPQLLNLLADGKQLTIDELARVIEFLQELRQRMIRDQGGVDPAAEAKDFPRSVGDRRGPTGGLGGGFPSNNGAGRKEIDMDLDSDEDSGAGQQPGGPPKSQNAQIQAKILSMIRPGGESSPSPGPQPKLPINESRNQMPSGNNLPPRQMPSGNNMTPRQMPSGNNMPPRQMPGGTNQPPRVNQPPRINQPPPMKKELPPAQIGPQQPQIRPQQPQIHPQQAQIGPQQPARAPAPVNIRALSQQPPPPPASAPGGPRGPRPPQPPPPTVTSGNINFDNPNVKKALDNLIQSGPNLLRTIGQVTASLPTQPTASHTTSTPQPQASAAAAAAATSLTAQQSMQAQQAQYAQYQAAAAQHNALMQAHMQAQAQAYQQQQQQQQQRQQTPGGYIQPLMGQQPGGGPRYGGPY